MSASPAPLTSGEILRRWKVSTDSFMGTMVANITQLEEENAKLKATPPPSGAEEGLRKELADAQVAMQALMDQQQADAEKGIRREEELNESAAKRTKLEEEVEDLSKKKERISRMLEVNTKRLVEAEKEASESKEANTRLVAELEAARAKIKETEDRLNVIRGAVGF